MKCCLLSYHYLTQLKFLKKSLPLQFRLILRFKKTNIYCSYGGLFSHTTFHELIVVFQLCKYLLLSLATLMDALSCEKGVFVAVTNQFRSLYTCQSLRTQAIRQLYLFLLITRLPIDSELMINYYISLFPCLSLNRVYHQNFHINYLLMGRNIICANVLFGFALLFLD